MVKPRYAIMALIVFVAAIGVWVSPCSIQGPPSMEEPRKVVLIALDTCRHDTVYDMENIDRWAAHAIQFTHCYSTSPWTFPAFASMMTSQYPSRGGFDFRPETYDQRLRITWITRDKVTLAEIMQDAGYTTAAFVNSIWVGKKVGFHQGFDFFHKYSNDPCEDTFRLVTKWLEAHGDESYFIFLHFMDTHLPYRDHSSDAEFGGDDAEEARENPEMASEELRENVKRLYQGEADYFDEQFGAFMDAHNYFADALVIFTSDHGEEFWEHGGFEHGHSMYDEVIRVPLIMQVPRYEPPAVMESPVTILDIAPTILDWCMIPNNYDFEGISLFGRVPTDRWLFHESNLYGDPMLAVTHEGNRFIMTSAGSEYYIEPGQRNNVIDDPFVGIDRSRDALVRFINGEFDIEDYEELRSLGYLGAAGYYQY